MSKTISTNKAPIKKIVKIILIIPLILIGLLAIYIGFILATDSLFDRLDHDKFANLDTQMQTVFQKIKAASNGDDDWKYTTSCDFEMSGDFQTGRYICKSLISMEKTVTSAQEVSDLQAKYYPIVDNSDALKQKTELDLELPGDFGKKFVVSGAEKNYIEKKSGIVCNYSNQLLQSDSNASVDSGLYGSQIIGPIGFVDIRLECTETARDYWYTISRPELLADPNAPLIKL